MTLFKILLSALYCCATAYYDYGQSSYNSYSSYNYQKSWDEKALDFAEDFVEDFAEELWNTMYHNDGNFTVFCVEPLICVKYKPDYNFNKGEYKDHVVIEYDFTGKQDSKNSFNVDITCKYEHSYNKFDDFQIAIHHTGNYAQMGLGQNPASIEDFQEVVNFALIMDHGTTYSINKGLDIKLQSNYVYNINGKNESLTTDYHIFTKGYKLVQKKNKYGYKRPSTEKYTLQVDASCDITDGLRSLIPLPEMDMSVSISNKVYLNFNKMKFYLKVKGTAFSEKLPKIVFGLGVDEKRNAAILHVQLGKDKSTIAAKIFADGWGKVFAWMQDSEFTKKKPLHILTYPVTYKANNAIETAFEGFLGVGPGQNETFLYKLADQMGRILDHYTYKFPEAVLETIQLALFADKWSADIKEQNALDFSPLIKASKIDSGLVGLLLFVTDGTKEGEFNKFVADQVSSYSSMFSKELARELAFMGEYRTAILDMVGEKGKEQFNALFSE